MFNNLIGKNKELGRFLFCERYTLPPVKNAMYIAEGQELKKGAVVDVNGYLIGTAGLQPYAVLEFDCDTREGGKEASVFLIGEFNYDKLSFADGLSKDDMDNIVYNARKLGIVIKPYSFSLGFVPQADDEPENFEKAKKYAKVGDAIYADSLGNVHVIEGKSVKASTIPEGWEFVGVVALREGTKATILHKDENNSVKFASCWKWEISGIKYGEENTIQFCQRKADNTNIDIGDPLTFTPEDMDAAVTAIDTFLRANAGGSSAGAVSNYSWHCEKLPNYLGEDAVIVVADSNVDYRQYNSIINASGTTPGITAKTNMCDFLTVYGSTSMLRNNGGYGFRPGIVYDRLLEYYATNTTTANPSTMLSTSEGSDIVSRTQFNENQYCADLRATYVTFEKYIESIMLKWPSSEGAQATLYGTGKENTYLLDEQSHHLLNGTETKDYTAAAWAAAKSVDAEGLGAGAWYMPDIIEMLKIFGPMKVDGSDAVNATLVAAGISALSVASARWSPTRYSNYSAWILGSNGAFNHFISFYNTYRACCIAQYDVGE